MAFVDLEDLSHERIARLEDERRLRNLGVLAILTMVLPIAAGLYQGIFVWDLLPTAGGWEALRLITPALLGIGLFSLSMAKRLDRLTTGVAGFLMLVLSAVLFTESELGYTDLFSGMIGYVGRRPLVVLVGLGLVALGGDLRSRDRLRKWSDGLLISGAILLFLLYILPQRGRPLAMEVVDLVVAIPEMRALGEVMGALFVLIFQLVPLALSLWAGWTVYGKRGVDTLASAARYGLSGLVILFSYRLFQQGFHGELLLLQLKAAALLSVATGTFSFTLGAVITHLVDNPLPESGQGFSRLARDAELRRRLRASLGKEAESISALVFMDGKGRAAVHPFFRSLMVSRLTELCEGMGLSIDQPLDDEIAAMLLQRLEGVGPEPAGSPPGKFDVSLDQRPTFAMWLCRGGRRLYLAIAMAFFVVLGVAWWSQYRPQPDLTWNLRDATVQEEAFLTWELPSYIYDASRRMALISAEIDEAKIHGLVSEENLAERRISLLESAKDLDPSLEQEVRALLDTLDKVDVAGRRWFQAIQPINERIRRLGLPFFLKGTYLEFVPEGKRLPSRFYFLGSYLVKDVRYFDYGGREYATIHASRSGQFYEAGLPLGYTHPDEPFALVMVDEVRSSTSGLIEALQADGTCGIADIDVGLAAVDIDVLCGQMLGDALEDRGIEVTTGWQEGKTVLADLQIAATEAHELQHQIDGGTVEIPGELFRLIPIASDRQLARAAHEISAYLTELTSEDPLTTLSVLAQLTSFLTTRDVIQSPYRYAAGVIFSELAGDSILRPYGSVRMGVLLDAWKTFHDKGEYLPRWMSQRAREIHEDLLGTPCGIATPI